MAAYERISGGSSRADADVLMVVNTAFSRFRARVDGARINAMTVDTRHV